MNINVYPAAILTQFFVCNRFAVTKLEYNMREQQSTRDVFRNPCKKRTSSVTCNTTAHEMRADCGKLLNQSSHVNVSQY